MELGVLLISFKIVCTLKEINKTLDSIKSFSICFNLKVMVVNVLGFFFRDIRQKNAFHVYITGADFPAHE